MRRGRQNRRSREVCAGQRSWVWVNARLRWELGRVSRERDYDANL